VAAVKARRNSKFPGETADDRRARNRLLKSEVELRRQIESGSWVFAGGLHPANIATVVRVREGGEVLMTDGPFAEGKEHVGGFWVIAAPDLDAALAWAAKATRACDAPVEVRPFHDVSSD
jgi:hypothetical protein